MKAASVCKTLESKFQWQCHSVSRACAAASGAKAAATEEEEAFLLDMREVLTTEPEAETRM